MSLPNLFSRRKREASGKSIDVYSCDQIPVKVRVQIVQIISDAIGPYRAGMSVYPPGAPIYENIVRTMRREKGVFELSPAQGLLDRELFNWLIGESDLDSFIDGIEYSFWAINTFINDQSYGFREYVKTTPARATAELNARLQEAGIGYQFDGRDIIKVTSQMIHSEVVLPALRLIYDPLFASVDKEYRDAHANFKVGEYESCLVECGKAFESALKVIGAARGWSIKATDPASKLLSAAFAANFIPSWMQAEFTALKALLESAVPAVRNKMGGHGAGTATRSVPKELAAFQLHQTAACIVFLIDHHKANS